MGGDQSKESIMNGEDQVTLEDLIKYLHNETKFTMNEVSDLVEHFRWINYQINGTRAITGAMNEPGCIIWLLGFWSCTMEQVPVLQDYFTAMDTDVNGIIDVHEYLVALSAMTRGNDEEKLQLLFRAIDSDRDGHITRDEAIAHIRRMVVSEIFWMNFYQELRQESCTVEELEFAISDATREHQVEMECEAIRKALDEGLVFRPDNEKISEEDFVNALVKAGFEATFIVPVIDQLKARVLTDLRSVPTGRGEERIEVLEDGAGV